MVGGGRDGEMMTTTDTHRSEAFVVHLPQKYTHIFANYITLLLVLNLLLLPPLAPLRDVGGGRDNALLQRLVHLLEVETAPESAVE